MWTTGPLSAHPGEAAVILEAPDAAKESRLAALLAQARPACVCYARPPVCRCDQSQPLSAVQSSPVHALQPYKSHHQDLTQEPTSFTPTTDTAQPDPLSGVESSQVYALDLFQSQGQEERTEPRSYAPYMETDQPLDGDISRPLSDGEALIRQSKEFRTSG